MADIDPDTGLPVLIKQPWEDRLYDIPFCQELRPGDTIASVTGVSFENMGEVSGSGDITIAPSPAHNDDTVQPRISGGHDGENYKLEAQAVTAQGDSLEIDVMLYVRD